VSARRFMRSAIVAALVSAGMDEAAAVAARVEVR
jgi:hypothetical protein